MPAYIVGKAHVEKTTAEAPYVIHVIAYSAWAHNAGGACTEVLYTIYSAGELTSLRELARRWKSLQGSSTWCTVLGEFRGPTVLAMSLHHRESLHEGFIRYRLCIVGGACTEAPHAYNAQACTGARWYIAGWACTSLHRSSAYVHCTGLHGSYTWCIVPREFWSSTRYSPAHTAEFSARFQVFSAFPGLLPSRISDCSISLLGSFTCIHCTSLGELAPKLYDPHHWRSLHGSSAWYTTLRKLHCWGACTEALLDARCARHRRMLWGVLETQVQPPPIRRTCVTESSLGGDYWKLASVSRAWRAILPLMSPLQ